MSAKTEVQRCADLLRGADSDTEKFAALMLVTKVRVKVGSSGWPGPDPTGPD